MNIFIFFHLQIQRILRAIRMQNLMHSFLKRDECESCEYAFCIVNHSVPGLFANMRASKSSGPKVTKRAFNSIMERDSRRNDHIT